MVPSSSTVQQHSAPARVRTPSPALVPVAGSVPSQYQGSGRSGWMPRHCNSPYERSHASPSTRAGRWSPGWWRQRSATVDRPSGPGAASVSRRAPYGSCRAVTSAPGTVQRPVPAGAAVRGSPDGPVTTWTESGSGTSIVAIALTPSRRRR
ncbi:hypothetical protein ACFWMG_32495 [Streptomyces sp. NPDC127074]|uniref:hypothetical protein n=1 Tax=Streptomyces sp. NPDC127074 TaxID=3347130 RepID=UPI0036629006